MNAFIKQFKDLWEVGGPFATVMGVVSFVLVAEGARFILWSEISKKVSEGEIDNVVPFFVQGFGAIALGLLFLLFCLSHYRKMKMHDLEKDKAALCALRKTVKTVSAVIEKSSGPQLAGQLNLVQTTVDNGNELLRKLIEKNYT